MANRHRGEIAAVLDGREWTLCLTLGALAELENRFGADDLGELLARLTSGKLSAAAMRDVIAAGLRGAGHLLEDDEIEELQAEGGAVGYARIVADLIEATFGASDDRSTT